MPIKLEHMKPKGTVKYRGKTWLSLLFLAINLGIYLKSCNKSTKLLNSSFSYLTIESSKGVCFVLSMFYSQLSIIQACFNLNNYIKCTLH